MNYLKIYLSLIILTFSYFVGQSAEPADAVEANKGLFEKLDLMVNNNRTFVERKNSRIADLKIALRHAASLKDKYDKNKQLYDEYFTFDSDSAIVYARKSRELAFRLDPNDVETQHEWRIKEAFVYSACGIFSQALEVIRPVKASDLPKSLLPEYYNTMEYLYSHYALYTDDDLEMSNRLRQISANYKDSLGMVIDDKHPFSLWYCVSYANGKPITDKQFKRLKSSVDSSSLSNRNEAINAYWLAKAYESGGDNVEMVKYLIKSAIADVNAVNRDIASLQELALFLYNNGDVNRAYSYLNYCMDQAQHYHNRIRVVSLSSMQEDVRKAYLEILDKQEKRMVIYLVVLAILVIVLIVLVFYMVRQYRKIKQNKEEVSKLNTSLSEHVKELDAAHKDLIEVHEQEKRLNDDLTQANELLNESNCVKQEYIGYAFTLSTDFITDLDDLRKKLLRKVKTRQFGELTELLESQSLVQEELRRFYRSFDETFIHIYPNFVDEYNAEQDEDDKIEFKEGELLNTKLRIWALHRLGITESAKIAKMLRCSIQTVYNNRPKKKK